MKVGGSRINVLGAFVAIHRCLLLFRRFILSRIAFLVRIQLRLNIYCYYLFNGFSLVSFFDFGYIGICKMP